MIRHDSMDLRKIEMFFCQITQQQCFQSETNNRIQCRRRPEIPPPPSLLLPSHTAKCALMPDVPKRNTSATTSRTSPDPMEKSSAQRS